MKLLWAYDHHFLDDRPNQHVYSRSHFPHTLWDRYLQHTDQLVVAGRQQPQQSGESEANLVRSDRPEIEFLFLPSLTNPANRFSGLKIARAKLEAAIRECDGVIARVPSENGYLAADIAQKLNKPWLAEVVGCAWDCHWNYGSILGKCVAPFSLRKMKATVARSPFALYVTERFLQERYPTFGITAGVSNVVLPDLDSQILDKRIQRIAANKPPFTIGLIGYIGSKIKGVHVALRALKERRADLPEFHFEIVGGGDASPWVALAAEYGLADRVTFKGLVKSGQPIFDWLEAVDLYIQPSFQEGLPRATVEALSRACPALGSTAGGMDELLPQDCLHQPGDHRILGQQFVKFINDHAWQTNAAKTNFENAKRYQKEILDQKRADLFGKFAAATRKSAQTTIEQQR